MTVTFHLILSVLLRSLSNTQGADGLFSKQHKVFIYWKNFGVKLNKHDGINNMHGWFQKFKKYRKTSSTQHGKGIISESPATPVSSISSSSSPPSLSASSEPQQLGSALNSELRWKQKYDVFVCHSSTQTDIEEATRLVLFLEAAPRSLRCFLWHRDTCPGAAISTEFCQAVQDSHIRALLITPGFVQDDWCNYVMHQALAEGPMSNRMIPLLQNLPHSQYPQEMKFYYYIDLSKNPDRGFSLVYRTVYRYLENLSQKEMKCGCNLGDSNGGGDRSSSTQELMPKHKLTGTTNK